MEGLDILAANLGNMEQTIRSDPVGQSMDPEGQSIDPDGEILTSSRARLTSSASFNADDHLACEESLARLEDESAFFGKGRDFQSAYVNHQYTEKEKEILSSYDTQDYLPPHSKVYKTWLSSQPARLEWDRWVMMGLIGSTVGFIGFLLHQLIDVIADFKWKLANELVENGSTDLLLAWLWVTGYSLIFLVISTVIVVFLRPSAAGSGMPELIGFLNGTFIRHIFNVKTFAVKFFSCALAVGSGMPVGPEGPMIHLGSLVGAGLSQVKSTTIGIDLPFFTRFRNSEDRRNFISAGAAAGIASAFGAPVGGLLFAMEEVSSFWNMKLSWQVFFCSMVSAFTTDLFNSAFSGFEYQGEFGQFKKNKYILFVIDTGIDLNILALIPSIILGIIGGLLGSLFIFINLKLARLRRRMHSKVSNPTFLNLMKVLEPVIILVITCTVSVLIPAAFSCTPMSCLEDINTEDPAQCTLAGHAIDNLPQVEFYSCAMVNKTEEGKTQINVPYNQAATLFFVTGEKAIQHLFSRDTHYEFDYMPLFTFLVIYFILACWASGTNISCGLVVPMLLIGGLYGRILGRAMVDLFGTPSDHYWNWIDPGAMALLGGASFFGGVSRLTMSLAVIMVEITNDIQFLLLIMTSIMVAKWTGDLLTHSVYHSLLELKCIPFLDHEPVLCQENGKAVSLEQHTAEEVMSAPVRTVGEVEGVAILAELLLNTSHGGFPVVTKEGDDQTFEGLITRSELLVLMNRTEIGSPQPEITYTEFTQVSNHSLKDPLATEQHLRKLMADAGPGDTLDLRNYTNKSAMSIQKYFSLHRAYILIRSLGLRHLTVVDSKNNVQGIITRRDLMGFSIEGKLLGERQLEEINA